MRLLIGLLLRFLVGLRVGSLWPLLVLVSFLRLRISRDNSLCELLLWSCLNSLNLRSSLGSQFSLLSQLPELVGTKVPSCIMDIGKSSVSCCVMNVATRPYLFRKDRREDGDHSKTCKNHGERGTVGS